MRKKYLILGCSLVLATVYSCKTHYKLADERFTLIAAPGSEERGKNIANNVCGECHFDKGTGKFTGRKMNDLPKFMGKIYTSNLTHSKTNGVLQHYTDAELAYLLKTGIANDGRYIPYMVRPKMAEDDINDLIVFLHSSDPTVASADVNPGHTHITMLGRWATNISGKPQPFIEGIKKPAANDAVANGRYLVDIVGCFHCHSKSIPSLNYVDAERSKGYMKGGMSFKSPGNGRIKASNLTPDKANGIGKYTEKEFAIALKDGKTPDGRKLRLPMGRFTHLNDNQIADIFAYLKTLPPSDHKITH